MSGNSQEPETSASPEENGMAEETVTAPATDDVVVEAADTAAETADTEAAAGNDEESNVETTAEEFLNMDGEEMSPSTPLDAELTAARNEAEENRNAYLRMAAEMQNFRKRSSRDQQQARQFAIEGFAKDLLPVADNLDRALDAIREGSGGELKILEDGVRMIQQELVRTFDKHGVKRIDSLNTPFDPNLHQAVMHVEDPDGQPGDVVQEMQSGYLLNGRLLRPAMVSVAKEC